VSLSDIRSIEKRQFAKGQSKASAVY